MSTLGIVVLCLACLSGGYIIGFAVGWRSCSKYLEE